MIGMRHNTSPNGLSRATIQIWNLQHATDFPPVTMPNKGTLSKRLERKHDNPWSTVKSSTNLGELESRGNSKLFPLAISLRSPLPPSHLWLCLEAGQMSVDDVISGSRLSVWRRKQTPAAVDGVGVGPKVTPPQTTPKSRAKWRWFRVTTPGHHANTPHQR